MPSPPCPRCGFDGAGLTPLDGVAALRSYPRRFRSLLDPEAGNGDGAPVSEEVLAARRDAVRREAAAAAAEMTAAAADLRRVLIENDAALGPKGFAPGAAPADAEAAVDSLERAAGALAQQAEATSGKVWDRAGKRSGQTVRAIDLLREAVHAGAHHLRAASG